MAFKPLFAVGFVANLALKRLHVPQAAVKLELRKMGTAAINAVSLSKLGEGTPQAAVGARDEGEADSKRISEKVRAVEGRWRASEQCRDSSSALGLGCVVRRGMRVKCKCRAGSSVIRSLGQATVYVGVGAMQFYRALLCCGVTC